MSKNRNNNRPKRSIRTMILAPVILLGIVSIASNVIGLVNINRMNAEATVIAEDYVEEIQNLAEIQNEVETIHNLALSHIIATDFDSMINIVSEIESTEAELEANLNAFQQQAQSLGGSYSQLTSDYTSFKLAVRELLGHSADTKTSEAYAVANGDLATYANAMYTSIDSMNDTITAATAEATGNLRVLYNSAYTSNIITILISLVAVLFAAYIVFRYVIKPVVSAQKEISDIVKGINEGNGDLTRRIPITSNDEIAELNRSINSFLQTLQHIFSSITNNTNQMDTVVSEVLGSVRTSNESATDLSAFTEELSATMQDVSNNAGQISERTASVNEDVNLIAERTSEITEYSKTMKSHADSMEKSARQNMENTNKKVEEITSALSEAIEASGSVDQVNSLTNDILSISSQTNLLSLNASIEAARAGEAGKGFAVVAEEISQLADDSRNAANRIQQINHIVVEAVNNLADQSNSLLAFIQSDILPEFADFVNQGNQYKKNADHIEEAMEEFSEKTTSLQASMEDITNSITSITGAIQEGVQGVTGAAESTQTFVADMDNITRRMDENESIANTLQDEISIFKQL